MGGCATALPGGVMSGMTDDVNLVRTAPSGCRDTEW